MMELIEGGADVTYRTGQGPDPLMAAVHPDQRPKLLALTKSLAQQNDWPPPRFQTDHLAVVQKLLEAGADLQAVNADGNTALHSACMWGDPGVVRALLNRGADLHAKGFDAFTPLHCAVDHGHLEIVRLLLERGADVEAHDTHPQGGGTPLLLAAYSTLSTEGELLAVTELLLASGADINARMKSGEIPLHRAALNNYTRIAQALLDGGADINCQDTDNRDTPLHVAARVGHADMVRLLIEHDADPTLKNRFSKRARYEALAAGHKRVAQLLKQPTYNALAVPVP